MTIKIVLPKTDSVKTANGTRLFTDSGVEITDVTDIKLNLAVDSIITATVEVCVNDIENMDNIYALLGVETIEQIADMHGFSLIKKDS